MILSFYHKSKIHLPEGRSNPLVFPRSPFTTTLSGSKSYTISSTQNNSRRAIQHHVCTALFSCLRDGDLAILALDLDLVPGVDAELIQPFASQVDLRILMVSGLPSTIIGLGSCADSNGAFVFHYGYSLEMMVPSGTKMVRNVSGMDYRKMCLPYQRMRVSESTISGRYFYICRKEMISSEK